MVQESIRDNERLDWAVETFIRPQREPVEANMRAEKALGIWPDIPDASLAYIIVASSQMPFVLAPEVRRVHGVDILDPGAVDAHAEAMITLFLDHRAADPET
ncbi:MAG: hypothetical protein WA906_09470 [Pacificimonas sp.]